MTEHPLIAIKFVRDRNDCVKNVYCLCENCRSGKAVIQRVKPAMPKTSYGHIDDKPRLDAEKPIPFTTHQRITLESDTGEAITCWQIFDGTIAFGKGVWKI